MSEPDDIVTLTVVSGTDNTPLQYISAARLTHLESVEKLATDLVRKRRQFEIAYRDLEEEIFKEVPT